MESVDLGRKNWLVPFFRAVVTRFERDVLQHTARGPRPDPDDEEFLDKWLRPRLRERGLLSGTQKPIWPLVADADEKERASWFFFNTLAHQVELLLELRLRHGHKITGLEDQLRVLSILSAHVEDFEGADTLFELTLDDWGLPDDPRRARLTKKMGPTMRQLGSRLKDAFLQAWNQPLLGLPFHHVLNYADTCQLTSIAHAKYEITGRIDAQNVRQMIAHWHMEKVHLIEAVIALAAADGVITSIERRLIEHIIEMARLAPNEERLIWTSLEDPMTAKALGTVITDKGTRSFVFEQILLNAQLEGDIGDSEKAFVEELAVAFGISEAQLIAHEAEALNYLETNPELIDAFSLGGLVRRFRTHLTDQVESIVRVNLGRIVKEMRETGELGQLMVKRAQGPLTEEEEAKMREQILDICKTVPALAMFAAPGGSILLPIIMRLLPFDLMPSSFTEKDEAL